ncbi:MAG: hypothetical protein IKT67_07695 [Lachnospiraceae bacterium]|nr:hypothetical protein [Lachnospiraceae bacterium]
MMRAKKMLTMVVALAMMVLAGSLEAVTAEAAYCPHQFLETDVIYVTSPTNYSHQIPVGYDETLNEPIYATCYFYLQEYTYEMICTQCNRTVSTYKRVMETHRHVSCPEYGTSEYE